MSTASIVSPRIWREVREAARLAGVSPRDIVRRWLAVAAEQHALRIGPRLTGKPALANAA